MGTVTDPEDEVRSQENEEIAFFSIERVAGPPLASMEGPLFQKPESALLEYFAFGNGDLNTFALCFKPFKYKG